MKKILAIKEVEKFDTINKNSNLKNTFSDKLRFIFFYLVAYFIVINSGYSEYTNNVSNKDLNSSVNELSIKRKSNFTKKIQVKIDNDLSTSFISNATYDKQYYLQERNNLRSSKININDQLNISTNFYLDEEKNSYISSNINAQYYSQFKSTQIYSEELYFNKDTNFGSFKLGETMFVENEIRSGPSYFIKGAGGVKGNFLRYINIPYLGDGQNLNNNICDGKYNSYECRNFKDPHFIVIPNSVTAHGGYGYGYYEDGNIVSKDKQMMRLRDGYINGVEKSFKLNFISNRINNFKFGASYSPRSDATFLTNVDNDLEIYDIFNFAANYINNYNLISYAISFDIEKGDSKDNRKDLLAYNISSMLSYFGFTVGASYGNWGKSNFYTKGIKSCPYNPNLDYNSQNCNNKYGKADYFSFGILYEIGPSSINFSTLDSNFQKNKFESRSLGLTYKIDKNFEPYIELTKYKFSPAKILGPNPEQIQIKKTSGYVAISGIKLKF